MKILSKITMAIFLLGIVACEVERYPYDSIVADKLDESGAGIEAATLGNYAMLKSWTDNWYRLVEYPGDNVALSGTTSDALFFNYNYQHIPNNYRVATYWQNSYQVIVGTNKIFDTFEEGVSEENDQLLGENYYLRAMTYFYLTNIFGRPYTQNPASLAVPLKLDADAKVFPERATVEAVYQQIEADLLKAETLMSSFKENVYASPEAAQALLSRVYLYMEDNQQALAYADKVLASTNVSLLPTETLASYPTIVPESNDETIFAIKFVKDADNLEWSSIGSMFANIQGVGWGEMYASQPYLDLVRQYPSDQRNGFIDPVYLLNDAGEKTLWALYVDNKYQYEWLPVEGAPGQYTYTDANGNIQKLGITMAADDTTYTIKLADNTRQEVELEYRMADRNGYPKYYITKCSGRKDRRSFGHRLFPGWQRCTSTVPKQMQS